MTGLASQATTGSTTDTSELIAQVGQVLIDHGDIQTGELLHEALDRQAGDFRSLAEGDPTKFEELCGKQLTQVLLQLLVA